jgi:hypothetical protein
MGQVFLRVLRFPLQALIPPNLLSSGVGTKGVVSVPSGLSLIPHHQFNKNIQRYPLFTGALNLTQYHSFVFFPGQAQSTHLPPSNPIPSQNFDLVRVLTPF